jgi:hypothetical protein
MSLGYLLEIISTASAILPVIAVLYNYRRYDELMKIIAWFFVISAICDIALWLMPLWGFPNNVPVIHLFVIVNIIFFGIIYYKAFFDKKFKAATLALTGIALAVALFYTTRITVYPSESNTASSIAFIILSLIYFYQLLNRQEFVHIEKQGLFWFNSGVLFYFSINIFLFMLFNKIPREDQESFFIINNITNIIANLLYTTGLFCKPQKTA